MAPVRAPVPVPSRWPTRAVGRAVRAVRTVRVGGSQVLFAARQGGGSCCPGLQCRRGWASAPEGPRGWRVLFFGSDRISVATLSRLHDHIQRDHRRLRVEALHVVTSPGKQPTARGKRALERTRPPHFTPPHLG